MTGFQWESPLLWWSVSMSYQIWVAKNTMIQICHWISKFTCKSDNYTHSDTSILFHCQCPQLRSVYLKGRSLRRQNWLNWMECFSGLPNLPHSQVLLFEIKILIQEAGLPPDWKNWMHSVWNSEQSAATSGGVTLVSLLVSHPGLISETLGWWLIDDVLLTYYSWPLDGAVTT